MNASRVTNQSQSYSDPILAAINKTVTEFTALNASQDTIDQAKQVTIQILNAQQAYQTAALAYQTAAQTSSTELPSTQKAMQDALTTVQQLNMQFFNILDAARQAAATPSAAVIPTGQSYNTMTPAQQEQYRIAQYAAFNARQAKNSGEPPRQISPAPMNISAEIPTKISGTEQLSLTGRLTESIKNLMPGLGEGDEVCLGPLDGLQLYSLEKLVNAGNWKGVTDFLGDYIRREGDTRVGGACGVQPLEGRISGDLSRLIPELDGKVNFTPMNGLQLDTLQKIIATGNRQSVMDYLNSNGRDDLQISPAPSMNIAPPTPIGSSSLSLPPRAQLATKVQQNLITLIPALRGKNINLFNMNTSQLNNLQKLISTKNKQNVIKYLTNNKAIPAEPKISPGPMQISPGPIFPGPNSPGPIFPAPQENILTKILNELSSQKNALAQLTTEKQILDELMNQKKALAQLTAQKQMPTQQTSPAELNIAKQILPLIEKYKTAIDNLTVNEAVCPPPVEQNAANGSMQGGGNSRRRSTKRAPPRNKPYKFPRRFSRAHCKKKPCNKMGFTERASCRPYKNCYTRRRKSNK